VQLFKLNMRMMQVLCSARVSGTLENIADEYALKSKPNVKPNQRLLGLGISDGGMLRLWIFARSA
jgi:hypothetical protein